MTRIIDLKEVEALSGGLGILCVRNGDDVKIKKQNGEIVGYTGPIFVNPERYKNFTDHLFKIKDLDEF